MRKLKNWDNKTWLSSQKYIQTFNKFLLNQVKLDKNSRILDIGCGLNRFILQLPLQVDWECFLYHHLGHVQIPSPT